MRQRTAAFAVILVIAPAAGVTAGFVGMESKPRCKSLAEVGFAQCAVEGEGEPCLLDLHFCLTDQAR